MLRPETLGNSPLDANLGRRSAVNDTQHHLSQYDDHKGGHSLEEVLDIECCSH
jgi:hypothetical protein